MINLLGRNYTKNELLRYAGNINQIAGIIGSRFTDSKASSMQLYRVKTGSGLEYTILPDKCLDISDLSYKGINLSFQAKPGLVSASYGYQVENEFASFFCGGMLYTCGLDNVGGSCCDDDGKFYNNHGRIGLTPANNPYSNCYWADDENYVLEIGGVMRQAALFNYNLSLRRRIVSKLGGCEIKITDTLENNAPEPEDFMLLYHFNFGFPFLDDNLKIIFPENSVEPVTDIAEKCIGESEIITKPQDGFFEHVYYRDIKEDINGNVTVRLENERLSIGAYIKYEKRNLPLLAQWKSMRSGDYALGIEPANCHVSGRVKESENKTIKTIEPFSKLTYNLTLGVYDL